MNRTVVNLVIDLAAAALFLGMLATGYVLWFSLPPGTNRALSLWGLTRHRWGDVHAWISFAFLGVLSAHVCLHWQWLVSVVRKRLGRSGTPQGGLLRSGLVTFVAVAAVLGLFAWATRSGVREITDPERLGVCPPDAGRGEKGTDRAVSLPSVVEVGDRAAVDFWKDVYPVLERSCQSCHGPKRQRGNFRVDRREDFFGTEGRPALVVPGRSAESPLIAIVSGQRKDIPRPDVHRLPEREVTGLRAWIDAGAAWPRRPGEEGR
jgi:hypothetical protein